MKRTGRAARRARVAAAPIRTGLAALAALGLGLAGGCYGTYPKPVGVYHNANPNIGPFERIAPEAVAWALVEYELAGVPVPERPAVAISLPPRVRRSTWLRVTEAIGPAAVPREARWSDLPVVHIGETRVRLDSAEVDIFHPVDGVAGEPVAEGETTSRRREYQMITITLEGGFGRGWRVVRGQPWTVGAFPVPAFNDIPAEDVEAEPEAAAIAL